MIEGVEINLPESLLTKRTALKTYRITLHGTARRPKLRTPGTVAHTDTTLAIHGCRESSLIVARNSSENIKSKLTEAGHIRSRF